MLRRVELIAAEVAVRVMHLEAQANELVSAEATKEAREENSVATSALNSCKFAVTRTCAAFGWGTGMKYTMLMFCTQL